MEPYNALMAFHKSIAEPIDLGPVRGHIAKSMWPVRIHQCTLIWSAAFMGHSSRESFYAGGNRIFGCLCMTQTAIIFLFFLQGDKIPTLSTAVSVRIFELKKILTLGVHAE